MVFISVFLFFKSTDIVILPFLIRKETVRNNNKITMIKIIGSGRSTLIARWGFENYDQRSG